jgi:serine/threonine protein kinase
MVTRCCRFVYGDLKPENIVLTSSGHAKLTDFGAVRPFTEDAKRLIEESKDALKSLRSGDWKVGAGLTTGP